METRHRYWKSSVNKYLLFNMWWVSSVTHTHTHTHTHNRDTTSFVALFPSNLLAEAFSFSFTHFGKEFPFLSFQRMLSYPHKVHGYAMTHPHSKGILLDNLIMAAPHTYSTGCLWLMCRAFIHPSGQMASFCTNTEMKTKSNQNLQMWYDSWNLLETCLGMKWDKNWNATFFLSSQTRHECKQNHPFSMAHRSLFSLRELLHSPLPPHTVSSFIFMTENHPCRKMEKEGKKSPLFCKFFLFLWQLLLQFFGNL